MSDYPRDAQDAVELESDRREVARLRAALAHAEQERDEHNKHCSYLSPDALIGRITEERDDYRAQANEMQARADAADRLAAERLTRIGEVERERDAEGDRIIDGLCALSGLDLTGDDADGADAVDPVDARYMIQGAVRRATEQAEAQLAQMREALEACRRLAASLYTTGDPAKVADAMGGITEAALAAPASPPETTLTVNAGVVSDEDGVPREASLFIQGPNFSAYVTAEPGHEFVYSVMQGGAVTHNGSLKAATPSQTARTEA